MNSFKKLVRNIARYLQLSSFELHVIGLQEENDNYVLDSNIKHLYSIEILNCDIPLIHPHREPSLQTINNVSATALREHIRGVIGKYV